MARKITAIALFSGLLALGALNAGCLLGKDETPVERPRLLLLGVDGLEWDVILPLVRAGRMPEFLSLMVRGDFGLLESFEPTLSPIIWTTVATGKPAAEHGILGFDYAVPGNSGEKHLYNSAHRRTKALWNVLSDHRRRVAVVGWFMTYPVEDVSGVMVAQTNVADRREVTAGNAIWKGSLVEQVQGQVHPAERQDEMLALLRESDDALPEMMRSVFGESPEEITIRDRKLLEQSEWAFRADATYVAIGERLARDPEPYDLTAVYVGGADVVGHRFWRYLEPARYESRPRESEIAAFGSMIPDYYEQIDRMLGRLRRAHGDDLTIIVVSDHGMTPHNTDGRYADDEIGAHQRSGHHVDAPSGVFLAAGPGIREKSLPAIVGELDKRDLETVGSVYDIAPTVLALLDLPVGNDMHGEVLGGVLDPSFRKQYPVRRIPTHDSPEWLAGRPAIDGVTRPDEDERLTQLRDLGYVN